MKHGNKSQFKSHMHDKFAATFSTDRVFCQIQYLI